MTSTELTKEKGCDGRAAIFRVLLLVSNTEILPESRDKGYKLTVSCTPLVQGKVEAGSNSK